VSDETHGEVPAAVEPAARGRGELGLGVALGAVFGIGMLYLFGEETRFAVYGLGALIALTFIPGLVRRAGSVEHLLFAILVLSLQFDVALAYNYRPFKPAGPYGLLVSPTLLAAAVLFALRVVMSSRRLAPPLRIDASVVRWIAAMVVAGVLSSVSTVDRQLVSFGLFELLTVGLIAVVAMDQCATSDGLRLVQRMLAWTLVIQSVLIIVSFATGVQISLSHGVRGEDYGWAASGRFAGTLNTPSAASTMLVVCLLSALTRLYQRATVSERIWLYLELGLGSFALLLTQTRTAWIALIVGAAGVLRAAVRRGELSRSRLLSVAGMAFVVFLAAWPFIAGRVEESHSDDAEVRWRLVRVAVEMIKAHPLVGVGLNTATTQVQEYAARAGAEGWVFIVHNQFLLVWAETGILGFIAFVWLFRLGLRAARRLTSARDPALRNAGLWLYWSFIMLIWALNMDHVSGAATYKLVFFLFGVAAGAAPLAQGLGAREPGAPAAAPAAARTIRAA
jgi:putative inorganic carbon (HCO3(-)) transporter